MPRPISSASRRTSTTGRYSCSNQARATCGAVHELAAHLHRPKAPGLDALGEPGVAPLVGELDPRAGGGRQRHALEEEALVALQRQVADPGLGPGADLGDDLGHVRLDHLEPELAGDRDPVVAVLDEVQLADPVDVDRRHRLAAAHRLRDPLPAPAQAPRGGAEAAVELARAIDRADDRVELDRLQPEPPLAALAERLDDLVEGQDDVDVVGLAAQALGEIGEPVAAARAAEVGVRVLVGEPGVHPAQRTPQRASANQRYTNRHNAEKGYGRSRTRSGTERWRSTMRSPTASAS